MLEYIFYADVACARINVGGQKISRPAPTFHKIGNGNADDDDRELEDDDDDGDDDI